ncbi:hypothetical protein [Spirosoma horti]
MTNRQFVLKLIAVGLVGILLMFLLLRRKQYTPLTRTLMDLLMATTMGSFLLVLMIVLAS